MIQSARFQSVGFVYAAAIQLELAMLEGAVMSQKNFGFMAALVYGNGYATVQT